MNLKLSILTTFLVFGMAQNAQAMTTSTIVTDAIGTREVWTFEENLGVKNMVSRVNQVDGKGVYQTWDANNNLVSKTDSEGRVTTYTYNATNQRISMTEASDTADARTTTYEYISPDLDIVTKTTSPSIATGYSKEVINTYDAQQNVIKTEIQGFNPEGIAVSREMTFTYDSLGKVTQIDGYRTDVADITTFEYYDCLTGGKCGQIKQVSNALGHVTTYDEYNGNAKLLKMTDSSGVVTTHTYHPRNWLLSRTQTYTNVDGSTVSRTTSYVYDNVGQMIQSTSPDGTVLNYEYDAAHDLRAITDNLGNKVTYTYDPKGNRNQQMTFDPDGTLVRQIQTEYDIRNFVKSINSSGSVTQMVNDAVGNLTTQTDPNENPSTQSQYDSLYRLTNTINSFSNSTGYEYNVADQLVKVTAPNGAVTQYAYDDLDNLLSEVSPDRGTLTYTHNDAGNVLTQTDSRGITASYVYDALNRLTTVSYPNSSENIAYTYDQGTAEYSCHVQNDAYSIGKLCYTQDEAGETYYQYDQWGNPAKQTRLELGQIYITEYQYDDANRITKMIYPNGRVVNYIRDVIGRIIDVTTQLNETALATDVSTNRTYRADGLLTGQTLGNGIQEERTYDLQGRVTYIDTGIPSDTSVEAWGYAYDANGNILSIDKAKDSRTFIYDVLDRLVEDIQGTDANPALENSPLFTIKDFNYEYDENGNRLKKNNTNYQYTDFSNVLIKNGKKEIETDAIGNITQFRNGKGFTHSGSNRLRTVTNKNDELKATYYYNANNQRTQKVKPNRTQVFHYDLAGNLILKTWVNGHPREDYIWVDGQLAQYAKTKGNKIKPAGGGKKVPDGTIKEEIHKTYISNDHLATPRLGTNDDQTVTWRWESDGFNAVRPNKDPDQDGIKVNLKIGFPGQYWDSESGLYYNWNRYYDPKNARYITSDPIGLDDGVNTYAYVKGNPLTHIDFNGLYRHRLSNPPAPKINPMPSSPEPQVCVTNDDCPQEIAACDDLCSNLPFGATEPGIIGYQQYSSCMRGCIPARCGGNPF